MSILDEQRKQFAASVQAKKDNIIRQAINAVIGDDWRIEDLVGRGEFVINPDKTEIFKFDGVELIHFMVPRFDVDSSNMSTAITATQEYVYLNSATKAN